MPQKPTIVWFRDDLRLSDNPALAAAADAGAPTVCLYILEDGPLTFAIMAAPLAGGWRRA